MALNTSVLTEHCLYENQYVRIENVQATKTEMIISAGVYFSKEWSLENPPHTIEIFTGTFDIASDLNIWQQAYGRLKITWPAAIDC